jgi:hypothetical protein
MTLTWSGPSLAWIAAMARSVAPGSLTNAGQPWVIMISGSTGAPDAAASARTIRVIASRTRPRVAPSKARMLSRSSASAGMMLFVLPAWIDPTVTTAVSNGAISRETMA